VTEAIEQPAGIESTLVRSMVEAASVVHLFEPPKLHTSGSIAQRLAVLGPLVDSVEHDGLPYWSLRPQPRRAALGRMSPRAILERIKEYHARIATAEQELLEAWLAGDVGVIDKLIAAPEAGRQVSSWISGVSGLFPSVPDMQAVLARAAYRERLAAVGGTHFSGRTTELGRLDALLVPADGARLVVEAPGGIGKSALVAHWLWKSGAFGADVSDLFVALDLDDARLDLRVPETLTAAMIEQLDLQRPGAFGSLAVVAERGANRRRGAQRRDYGDYGTQVADVQVWATIDEVAEMIRAERRGHRFVLFIDTIERGLQRAPAFLERFLDLVNRLCMGVPTALVVAGRGPLAIPGLGTTERLQIGLLDEQSAVEVLEDRGIAPRSFAKKLAKKIGGHPLRLRLAARAVKDNELTEKDLESRAFHRAMRDNLIGGYLYQRILRHLGDPRLEKLVHPGFALRTITVDVVLRVLGSLTKPPVTDSSDAEAVFQALQRVHSLVAVVADGRGLRLRPDVRTEILQLMRGDDRAGMKRVHEAAVEYFRARLDEPEARAEAVYHLIHLRRFEDADALWTDAMRGELADASEDFRGAGASFLERKLRADAGARESQRDVLVALADTAGDHRFGEGVELPSLRLYAPAAPMPTPYAPAAPMLTPLRVDPAGTRDTVREVEELLAAGLPAEALATVERAESRRRNSTPLELVARVLVAAAKMGTDVSIGSAIALVQGSFGLLSTAAQSDLLDAPAVVSAALEGQRRRVAESALDAGDAVSFIRAAVPANAPLLRKKRATRIVGGLLGIGGTALAAWAVWGDPGALQVPSLAVAAASLAAYAFVILRESKRVPRAPRDLGIVLDAELIEDARDCSREWWRESSDDELKRQPDVVMRYVVLWPETEVLWRALGLGLLSEGPTLDFQVLASAAPTGVGADLRRIAHNARDRSDLEEMLVDFSGGTALDKAVGVILSRAEEDERLRLAVAHLFAQRLRSYRPRAGRTTRDLFRVVELLLSTFEAARVRDIVSRSDPDALEGISASNPARSTLFAIVTWYDGKDQLDRLFNLLRRAEPDRSRELEELAGELNIKL
jgi:hypothetical protein